VRERVPGAGNAAMSRLPGIGVLDRAAERRLIDLESAVTSLRQTNFRADPSLLEQLLAADRLRKKE